MREIITALNAAYKECGYVQKQGKMDAPGAKYAYAKESDFIAALRPALIEHGLTISPAGISQIHHEQYPNKSGTPTNRIVAVYTFRFAHISGETMDVVAMGEGVDTGDKAAYKAATGALKYALRQTLLIETGTDPDAETPAARETPEETKARQRSEDLARKEKWYDDQANSLAGASATEKADWLLNPENAKRLRYAMTSWKSQYAKFVAIGIELNEEEV